MSGDSRFMRDRHVIAEPSPAAMPLPHLARTRQRGAPAMPLQRDRNGAPACYLDPAMRDSSGMVQGTLHSFEHKARKYGRTTFPTHLPGTLRMGEPV